jgi:hypothetical protein
MKRLLGQTLFVLAVGSSAVALTPACAENDRTIFVRHVMAPPQNRQGGTCVYTQDENQPFLTEGTLDAAVSKNYVATLLVGSQLMPRGDQTNTRAESNRTHLNGAIVKVTDAAGNVINEFTSLGSGFVNPGQSANASFGLIGVRLLDAQTVNEIEKRLGVTRTDPKLVIANVKVFGKTLGGVDVESGEFQFPIRVCQGCLISFVTGDDPSTEEIDCQKPTTTAPGTGGTQIQTPCYLGQDETVPCELCRDYLEACRIRR